MEAGAGSAMTARWRRGRRRSRRRSRPFRLAWPHPRCASRRPHLGQSMGSGIKVEDGRIEESSDRVDLDIAPAAPAASISGNDSVADREARATPRASSRSRQAFPVRKTTRREMRGASTGNADAGSVMMLSNDRVGRAFGKGSRRKSGVAKTRCSLKLCLNIRNPEIKSTLLRIPRHGICALRRKA